MNDLSPDISRALRDSFGDEPVTEIAPMTGGRSGATLLSLNAGGKAYVLRKTDPAREDNAALTAHEIECMQIASNLGIAPKIRHVDVGACISIMERIDVAPRTAPRDPRWVERVIADHASPPSRRPFIFRARPRPIGMLDSVESALRAKGSARLPDDATALMREIAALTKRYESASCHHDLNPEGILDTGERVYRRLGARGRGRSIFRSRTLRRVFVSFFPKDGRDALLPRVPRARALRRRTRACAREPRLCARLLRVRLSCDQYSHRRKRRRW